MANIPENFDSFTEMSTSAQQYQVDLLTADVSDGDWIGAGGYALPTDPNYTPQEGTGGITDLDANFVQVEVTPVIFSGADYSSDQQISAYMVSLMYDDGNVPVATYEFENVVALGPQTLPLSIAANPACFSVGTIPYVQ